MIIHVCSERNDNSDLASVYTLYWIHYSAVLHKDLQSEVSVLKTK